MSARTTSQLPSHGASSWGRCRAMFDQSCHYIIIIIIVIIIIIIIICISCSSTIITSSSSSSSSSSTYRTTTSSYYYDGPARYLISRVLLFHVFVICLAEPHRVWYITRHRYAYVCVYRCV